MEIKRDNLENEKVVALLHEHLSDMRATSPPESVHALDVNALTLPNITFFSAWEGDALAGCIAIKKLNGTDAEIKSMRTSYAYRGQGVGNKLLVFLMDYAKEQGYLRISLETGTQDYFLPARKLYKKFGFVDCGPFSNYKLDPNSQFMSRDI